MKKDEMMRFIELLYDPQSLAVQCYNSTKGASWQHLYYY